MVRSTKRGDYLLSFFILSYILFLLNIICYSITVKILQGKAQSGSPKIARQFYGERSGRPQGDAFGSKPKRAKRACHDDAQDDNNVLLL